jgi:hypothetical protein
MSERRFHKGDFVSFRLGTRTVQGKVKEDRGPIGVQGRHLYLIEFHSEREPNSPSLIELPAEQLEFVQDAAATK